MADQNSGENLELPQQVEYLRGLAQIVADEGLSEIEIRADGLKLTLKAASLKFAPPAATAPLVMSAAPAPSSPSPTPTRSEENLTPVVSPMVGVFYRAPSPSDPNFVEIGDRVERGQTIGLVEAMKVFNEVTAENAGVVAQIPVQTGQLVETGQPLLLLK
ncbi:MAG: acetyl-CoA carboxylase biotin carboxyl carrier protein [Armatimonadetes bacterium]|nr:acetyl-CoA carboxylase biotin carboxyl carrier protein [Armatimonadota bacterium]